VTAVRMSSGSVTTDGAGLNLPSAHTFAATLALLRGFFGFVFLLNGIAKLFAFHRVAIGPLVVNLIDRADTRFILDVTANGPGQRPPAAVRSVVNDVFLKHFSFWQWVFTAAELGIGLLLVLGLASRLGALLGLLQVGFLALLYLGNDRWLFEQPLEVVPLLLLAVVPSGRVWGVDGSSLLPGRLRGRWPS